MMKRWAKHAGRAIAVGVALLALQWVLAGPTAAQGSNLLTNPGFEEPYNNGLANAWNPWHQATNTEGDACTSRVRVQPNWGAELVSQELIFEGGRSQAVGNQWRSWRGGVFQNVAVTAGETYQFSVYARGRVASAQWPAPSDGDGVVSAQVGIDPNGNGLWNDGDVVWGGSINPKDTWQQATVQVTATGNQISVFVAGETSLETGQCRQHLDFWFDAASLTSVAPPPTDTPPPPPPPPPAPVATNTPVPTETPLPTATPEPTATPLPTATPTETPIPGGEICVNAFSDTNANGQRDADEGYLAGVTLIVAQGATVVAQTQSTGSPTPICFSDLEAGEYDIAQSVPVNVVMTTAGNVTLPVEPAQSIGLEFGARIMTPEEISAAATAEAQAAQPQPVPIAEGTTGEAAVETPGTAESAPDAQGGGMDTLAILGVAILGVAVLLLVVIVVALVRGGRSA